MTMLWDKLYYNANLACMTDSHGAFLKNAAMAVKNNKIAWLGYEKDKPDIKAHENIDVKKQWILPAFIDCHTHLVFAGNRANEFSRLLHGESYADIAQTGGGILATVKACRHASFDDLLLQSEKPMQRLMAEGVATIEIKSGYGLDIDTEIKLLKVAKALGEKFNIRVKTTYLGAHALAPEFNSKDQYIDFICHEALPHIHGEGLIDFVDGFCENIAFSTKQIEKVFATAKKLNIPLKLHAEQLSLQGGTYLAALNQAVSIEHLEYADAKAIKAMAKSGSIAVLLPGAFYYLQQKQIPPIDLLRQNNVPIAIATDYNPGSFPIASLLLVLNMACVLWRLTPEEALLGATINAAKALQLDHEIGSLAVGKLAELTIWDIEHPLDLIYSACG